VLNPGAGGNLKEVLYQCGWQGLWQGNGVNAFCTAPLQAIELTFEAVKKMFNLC